MACLKRLLPAGYSGYSQIPAQSGSRSLPRRTKPPPAPGALLQTFINPFVLCAVSFEARNLACGFLQYISLLPIPNFFFFFFFRFKLPCPLLLAAPPEPSLAGRRSEGLSWLRQRAARGCASTGSGETEVVPGCCRTSGSA